MENLIEIKKIPNWLIDSELSKVLMEDFSKPFLIPIDKYEKNIIINNINDLYKYLNISTYWLLNDYPFEIYFYVDKNINNINFKQMMNDFPNFSLINELMLLTSQVRYKLINFAAEKDYLSLIKYARNIGINWNEKSCSTAAKYGNLNCLKYLIENDCPYDFEKIIFKVVKYGHLKCLIYLYEKGIEFPDNIFYIAIKYDKLDCLKYVLNKKCEYKENGCEVAASYGNLDILVYLHERGFILNRKTCIESAKNGFLDCLKYSIKNCIDKENLDDICYYALDKEECLNYLKKLEYKST